MEAVDSSIVYNMNIGSETAAAQYRMVSLYVGDLHPDVVENDLGYVFIEFRSLISVKVCKDYWTKESIGYGFVNFRDHRDGMEFLPISFNCCFTLLVV